MSASLNKKARYPLPWKRVSGLVAWTYLGALAIVPLMILLVAVVQIPISESFRIMTTRRVVAAFILTTKMAVLAAFINLIFGLVIAWVLVRYRFWGKSIVNFLVDLPFALPTSVTGIALVAAFSPQEGLGRWLSEWGVSIAYHPVGICLALVFVGVPFVVRYVQPVLEEFDLEMELAAQLLGASRLQTLWRVIMPTIVPAALAGFTAAFARGLGEYGSVIFISGNLPMQTEVISTIVMAKLEQFDYTGAIVISSAMMGLSAAAFGISALIQFWVLRRTGVYDA